MANKDDEIIHKGPITEFRPHKDDVSGGRDKSVQTEAKGAEGLTDMLTTSGSSGGGAGRITEIDESYQRPKRDGGESPDDESQPAGNRGNLTK
ncbi:MAG TPA: hypothetical protein VE010_15900 [Thermoanaerobaculia bacterium]|nr:hypothetical protein [Thermoanaerobaculia bacterium]